MTVAVYVQETSTITGTGTYDLNGAETGFQTFVSGLQNEHGASPMPTTWAEVGYVAYTLDLAGDYDEVEVGLGTVTNASPDTLSRADVNVSYSTTSNNRVSWPAGSTIYIVCTINAEELLI